VNASVKTIMKTSPFVIRNNITFDEKRRLFLKSDKILAPIVDDNRHVVDYISLPDVIESVQEDYEDIGILPPQRVLIVGGAGYIGSFLADKMLRGGYKVRIVDLLLYGKDPIKKFTYESFEFIRGDCRDKNIIEEALDGVDAVVHLGEIVGDPACNIDESFTIETNYAATQMIVELCVKRGIKRFVFASSCSVYGQNDEEVNEESKLNPISLYARCKIESEKAIQSFDYNHFCPTILRLATVHGKSFRQRFDLVVNMLAIKAVAEGSIKIFGGDQWRPFISVSDVCRGIIAVLNAEEWKVRKQVFNLGDTRENYQMIQMADIIGKLVPEVNVEILKDHSDKRSYQVCFEKIKRRLGFSAENKIYDSVKDIISAYQNENIFRDYRDQKYHNVLALKEC
jgi:nucleoside-diphosphate-sugar epimerase